MFYSSLFTWRKKTAVVVEPAVEQTVEKPPVEPAEDVTTDENGTSKLSTIKTC